MSGHAGKRKVKKSFSGNHQRSWLWGYHAVMETIRAGKWPIVEVFVTQEAFEESEELLQAQRQLAVPIEIAPSSRLEQLVRSTEHQGIVARMAEFPYLSLDSLIALVNSPSDIFRQSAPTGQSSVATFPPLFVVCDQIQDAFNFGAILRCCEGAAVHGVIVSDKCQAEVTPHVARASSGAVNCIPIARTNNLVEAVGMLKQIGTQVVAADSNATTGIWNTQFAGPTTLIVGSESLGISAELLGLCDQRVGIPMFGNITSLNAAVATGILLYEIRRQQDR